jgi:hypothetical protein
MSDGFEVESRELSGSVPFPFAARFPLLVDRQMKRMSGSVFRSHVLRREGAEAVGLTCLVDGEVVVCVDLVCLLGCEGSEALPALLRAAFQADRSRLPGPGLSYFAFIATRYEEWAAGAALAHDRIHPHPVRYTTGRPAVLLGGLPRRLGLKVHAGNARAVGCSADSARTDVEMVRRWWMDYSREQPLICVGTFPTE